MSIRPALLLTALAGCWSGAAPSSTAPAKVEVASLPPTIRDLHDGMIGGTGLPAVARDGSLVVFVDTPPDGARGNQAVYLVSKKRDDTKADNLVVLDPNLEYEEAERTASFAAANAWLERQHAAHPLVALAELPPAQIGWDGETRDLHITVDGVAVVVTNTPASWLVEPYPAYKGAHDLCENPAHLARAWFSRTAKVALLQIAFAGTDTCWEPPPRYHVVAW